MLLNGKKLIYTLWFPYIFRLFFNTKNLLVCVYVSLTLCS